MTETIKSFKYRLSQCSRKYKGIYNESILYLSQIIFDFNKKHYQTVTISPWLQLFNNYVLTWDYKNNNKYQVAMS